MQPYSASLSLCCHLMFMTGTTAKTTALLTQTQTEAVILRYYRSLDHAAKLKTATKIMNKSTFLNVY